MRRGVVFLAFLLLSALVAPCQIRVERDAKGRIVITNRGGKEETKRAPESKGSTPLPSLSSEQVARIRTKLRAACAKRGLDYDLVASLVQAESGFRPDVLSKKGAVGLMQLMPDTARRFGCRDRWNVDQNIKGGTTFLAHLTKRLEGNIPLILAAYNAGEKAVAKYGNRIPPYGETVRYVFTILSDYGRPEVTAQAKSLLTSPSDYDRFYASIKDRRPRFRVYYMAVDAKGVRHIFDYPPSGIRTTPIVYKDE